MSTRIEGQFVRKLGILLVWFFAAYFMFTEGSVVLVVLAIILTARNRRNTLSVGG